jgi:hypothetical protein
MSRATTLIVPDIAAISFSAGQLAPTILARTAKSTPMRALVRNVGGNVILISYSSNSVSDITQAQDSYRLPPGASDVFVLEIGDQIYSSAIGAAGLVSVSISPAFPISPVYGGS